MQAEIASLPLLDQEAMVARLVWLQSGRADQMPPPEDDLGWFFWLLMAGRGSGKTRAGAEDTWWFAYTFPGARIAVVSPTSDDCRKVCFEGESGLLAKTPPSFIENWNRGEKILTFTNGSMAIGYSADEPDRLRGPQHHRAWCDELAAWRYLDATLDNLLMGLRLGGAPRIVGTTTPRPIRRIKEIVAERRNDPKSRTPAAVVRPEGTTHLDTVSTYANARNLPKIFLDTILKRYEGTRLGRQELDADLLEDVPGALWKRSALDALRTTAVNTHTVIGRSGQPVTLRRVIVAVDPATKSKKPENAGVVESAAGKSADPDEWGIIVAGLGDDGRGYILADMSCSGTPAEVGEVIVRTYDEWRADRIVYEENQGGEMVLLTITTSAASLRQRGERPVDFVPCQAVWASKGKVTRAEPVSALDEQGRISHVGSFPVLEDQMCEFTSDFNRDKMGYSPDRVDARVWAITHLMLDGATDGTNIKDFYRTSHADMVEQAEALRTGGTSRHGLVCLTPPDGVGTMTGIQGDEYRPDADGYIWVRPDDVPPLVRAGARRAEEMA